MENRLQIFNHEQFGNIRAQRLDKDVLNKHPPCNKGVSVLDTPPGGKQKMVISN